MTTHDSARRDAPRPLAKALHTVTSTARVAAFIRSENPTQERTAVSLTLAALRVLGYSAEQVAASPALFDACVAAVAKGC